MRWSRGGTSLRRMRCGRRISTSDVLTLNERGAAKQRPPLLCRYLSRLLFDNEPPALQGAGGDEPAAALGDDDGSDGPSLAPRVHSFPTRRSSDLHDADGG